MMIPKQKMGYTPKGEAPGLICESLLAGSHDSCDVLWGRTSSATWLCWRSWGLTIEREILKSFCSICRCICMYTYANVCVYVCTRSCTYCLICIFTCMSLFVFVFILTHRCLTIPTSVYTCASIYVYIDDYIHVRIHAYNDSHACIQFLHCYTKTYEYVDTYIQSYICIYTCV